jgi:hypothetical protein
MKEAGAFGPSGLGLSRIEGLGLTLPCIDSKSQNRSYLDWFISPKCRAKFPAVQSHQNL